jgi:TRAP-type C4-dicarboxylate transport system substrate-binding protein
MQRISRLAAGALLAAAALTHAPEAEAQTSWTVYTYTPAATLAPARGLQRIAETVAKETDGALKLTIHLGGSLPIGSSDISNALSDGVVQLGDDGFFHGNLPITGILRLPMLIAEQAEFEKAKAVMRPYFERAYAKKGILMLGHYNYPLQVAWSTKPLRALGDFAGLKLRVTSPEQGEFVKRLGASAVTLGAPEVPTALDRGVVDGVFTASSGGGKLWKDLLKSTYRLGPNFFDGVIAVNAAAFAKLTPAQQESLKRAVAETAPWITQELAAEESKVTEDLAKGGIAVTQPTADETAKAASLMSSYWESWAKSKGADAVEALTKVRAAVGR